MTIATPSGQQRLFTSVGSDTGPCPVLSARTLVGDALQPARCLSVVAGAAAPPPSGTPWALTRDERRAVFEAKSHHIAVGLRYLPAVARRLHHCRDLGSVRPFDFLTWFDNAPDYEWALNDLLASLRSSAEWAYVDREVGIRLVREPA